VDETEQDTVRDSSLVGARLFGKLQVDSVLGRGGMGTVYRVTHLGTQHHRALKVMNPEIRLHAEALSRFLREATVSALLKSPYVVETLDNGQLDDGSLYVLMELLEGAPLNALIAAGPMKLPRIARLLGQACAALAQAHEKGIVHRDIKPDNLFVVRHADGSESVKLLDFGIARFREQRDLLGALTAENAILGTPLYMAPEQIGTANVADGRADIYALGVVLYEALSGRKPYSASSFAELVANIFDGSATPLERTAPGLTPRAYEVVQKAMARKPEDRYQSATELGEALHELEQPFRRPADPLAMTVPSVFPTPGALPSHDAPASALSATQAEAAITRGGPRRALVGGGIALLSGVAILALVATQLGDDTSAATAARVDAGVRDAGARVSAPRMKNDAGVAEAVDAGDELPATPMDPPPRRRPDAGRRRAPGGLAGVEEIYGDDG